MLDRSPMEPLQAPLLTEEELNPFTKDHQKRMIAAARKSHNPLRNETIVCMLIDNGVRVSELCSINVSQIDWDGKTGERLTRFGVGDLVEKLSIQAGILVENLHYSLILADDVALERVQCRNHFGTLNQQPGSLLSAYVSAFVRHRLHAAGTQPVGR